MKLMKQINIKEKPGYFFYDMTNINDIDLNLSKIDKVSFLNDELIMYDVKYIKELNSLNTPFLVFNNLDAYIKKSCEHEYLIFASVEKNKMILKSYTDLFNEIGKQTELINGDEMIKYSKDIMRTKF